MAFDRVKERYIPRENSFYRNYYHFVIVGLMLIIMLLITLAGTVFYQMMHRPLPEFNAIRPDGQRMLLTPFDEPNLLPETILRFASKAAVVAYTFNFNAYNQQIAAVRPYFTDAGWQDYLNSVSSLIDTIAANQLFVYGVVSGTPVISNQGPLPGKDYVWRVQIPFLVTYQSSEGPTQRNFYVTLTIVRVPTSKNPQGIGIDQFVMV